MAERKTSDPAADRPHIPGYGIPTSTKGTLPWGHVVTRLETATNYWIATANLESKPHSVPVMGAWVSDTLYFGGGPEVLWARNLSTNPQIAVHLESGSEAVILEGTAARTSDGDDLGGRVADEYERKYGFRHPPPFWRLDIRVAFAWTDFTKDPTRWRFR
jgi:hypothetical protein